MIYCGYQGCGKSTYCKAHPDTTIDLDSSNFPKVDKWEYNYIAVARELELTTNKAIFISAHQCVINALRALHIPFEVFVPAHDKEAWRHRLAFRYNNAPHQCNFNALADFEKNFEKCPTSQKSSVSATVESGISFCNISHALENRKRAQYSDAPQPKLLCDCRSSSDLETSKYLHISSRVSCHG